LRLLAGVWYGSSIFLTIVLYITWTLYVTEKQRQIRKKVNDCDNHANAKVVDSLLNFETVKYFTKEKFEVRRYKRSLDAYFSQSIRQQLITNVLNIGQGAMIALELGVCVILATVQVERGVLSVGDVVAINAYVLQLWSPLSNIAKSYRGLSRAFTYLHKLFKLMHKHPNVVDAADAVDLNMEWGEIIFDNVTFSYRSLEEEHLTLKNISFTVPGGSSVAIVGPSGSGKSTLLRLLCRFYDPESGRVLVDDQDISKVKIESLRRSIGVVPQDTTLFNDTLFYNVAYGSRGKVTLSEVEIAAEEASLLHFVSKLPDGWQTIVGERGLRLSGGEKQRVAIARTILKDPVILLLDEATSSLDSKTEQQIQTSLVAVSRGRTTVTVAHRLSTITHCDQILVLSDGVIVEQGTHSELLKLNGEYYRMWQAQTQAQE